MTKKDIESKGFEVTFFTGKDKLGKTCNKVTIKHKELGISRFNDDTRSIKRNMNRAYQQMVRDLKEIEKYLQTSLIRLSS